MRALGLLSSCAVLWLTASARAAQPGASPAERLRAALDKVATHGQFYPPEAPIPGRVQLEDPEKPDESRDHVVHIAAIYGPVMNGRFYVQLGSLESRAWTRQPDGNWKMEQWLFRLTLQGEIERAIHRVRIENPQHTNIFRIDQEDVAVNNARVKALYKGMLDHWDAWRPEEPNP